MASNDKPNTMSKFEANSRKCRAEVDHHTKHAWVVVLEVAVDIQEEQDKHKEKAKQEPKFSLNYHAPPFVPRCAKQHAFEEARPKLPATGVDQPFCSTIRSSLWSSSVQLWEARTERTSFICTPTCHVAYGRWCRRSCFTR